MKGPQIDLQPLDCPDWSEIVEELIEVFGPSRLARLCDYSEGGLRRLIINADSQPSYPRGKRLLELHEEFCDG